MKRLFGAANASPYVKDAFGEFVVHGRGDAVNPANTGTKAALCYQLNVPPRGEVSIRLRLSAGDSVVESGGGFDEVFGQRHSEADQFYSARLPKNISPAE